MALKFTLTGVDIFRSITFSDSERLRITLAVAPPAAYLVPPQWTDVIQRLELHGIRFFRLKSPQTLDIDLGIDESGVDAFVAH